ncbi:hypothetical protein MWU59_05295 [Flavobacteriaceae bacterium F08102]|nr:hypothetical protein [Flavobacteriaceae bacterium F08102]
MNQAYQNPEEQPRSNKKRKKRFSPYKKEKYTLSKLEEYENYLRNIESMSRGYPVEN